MWRGGFRFEHICFPPLSSGGALVVRPWLRFHIPLIEPDRRISRIRLSDKTPRLYFRVRRHLQFLNTFRSLIGCPISTSFTTYCVCLELRSLPSTGVTQLQRYYEPLRHPRAPGRPSRASSWSSLRPRRGASRVAYAFLVYMLPPLPRRSGWAYRFAQSPSRVSLPRKGRRVGLRIVLFEACSAV